jgi:hypothetical protein
MTGKTPENEYEPPTVADIWEEFLIEDRRSLDSWRTTTARIAARLNIAESEVLAALRKPVPKHLLK